MSPTDDDKQTKKTPRPNEVKNIPDGALIQRSTKGDLLAFFSYAKLPSGERPRKYIGKVFDLIFYPDPEFQAYPERFPRPIKGKPGRKPAPAPAADIPPVQAEVTANPKPEKSEGIINGGKPANLECGAPALLLAAANNPNSRALRYTEPQKNLRLFFMERRQRRAGIPSPCRSASEYSKVHQAYRAARADC